MTEYPRQHGNGHPADDLAAYALGALEPAEAAAVERAHRGLRALPRRAPLAGARGRRPAFLGTADGAAATASARVDATVRADGARRARRLVGAAGGLDHAPSPAGGRRRCDGSAGGRNRRLRGQRSQPGRSAHGDRDPGGGRRRRGRRSRSQRRGCGAAGRAAARARSPTGSTSSGSATATASSPTRPSCSTRRGGRRRPLGSCPTDATEVLVTEEPEGGKRPTDDSTAAHRAAELTSTDG